MCLVELKNSPKPVVSCAMSAKSCLNNSEVFTNSPLVKKARENILEFLLLNHPLDCPICDQGGECDLQDQSLFFGLSKKRFYSFKRVVTDKNIGPIVKTVMTRCIHCTRCVRFASEIAGVDDLGMFGRGMNSEIGTYVEKTFQSELSGNIIDLCPVGALTSKPYPFVSRSWELKNINSIDFSDGFGSNLQVYIKNNNIIKVLPGFQKNEVSSNWISDKTRFSFDGMFSPERVLQGFIKDGKKNTFQFLTWELILDDIVSTLYFQDHLNRHLLEIRTLIIVINDNTSLEVLNLLNLFAKKYSFIKLRKSEGSQLNNDDESSIMLNSVNSLNESDLCLLIGINTRYEGSNLNLKLRKRYLKGNFKLISINSLIDLTFPTFYMGINLKNLKSIVEGNNLVCQDFASHTNPTIIASSEINRRKDSKELNKLLTLLKYKLNKYYSNWNNLNILSSSINETGMNYLNNFKGLKEQDLKNSYGVYFLNSTDNTLNIKKLINLKQLNYLNSDNNYPKLIIDQNNGFNTNTEFLKAYKSNNYINLPNSNFFESNGTYLNTEGIFKTNVKFLSSTKQTKEDWQIIRKIFAYSKRINFTTNIKENNIISFNNTTNLKFKNFTGFLYYANTNLTKYNFYLTNSTAKTKNINQKKFKFSRNKLNSTNFKLWINDFYLGGKDAYSKYSVTMIKCSKQFRLEKTNFNYVL
uniref:NADH dehydrogenase subunit 11 n=1 Tax=Hemiaulus sinensis TaxID=1003062 RepID=UPI002028EAF4|nr:NADH dehydrogenase subunit 11 [Hemiaulus sinensis]QYB23178.1 NADH dehydrogenase subunit 11 [Hemiaulus sinensis]